MKLRLFAVLLSVAPMTLIGLAPRVAAAERYAPKIALEDARKAALAKLPGTVIREELERPRGHWQWSFHIRPDGQKRIHEVNIDPETGDIIKVD